MIEDQANRKLNAKKEHVNGVDFIRYHVSIPIPMAKKLGWKPGQKLKVIRGVSGIFIRKD